MIVVGVTGSIAMGKSTVSAMFAALGAPVFDADAAVRAYYAGDGAPGIEAAFPGVTVDGRIDRERLSKRVLGDPVALKRLESLVHPEVEKARLRFLERAVAEGRRLAIVDVPLLFETGGDASVDIVLVVSAPKEIHRARALARAGMNEVNLEAFLSQQTSDGEKRRRAHFVIDTRGTLEQTRAQVRQFMRAVAALEGHQRRHA